MVESVVLILLVLSVVILFLFIFVLLCLSLACVLCPLSPVSLSYPFLIVSSLGVFLVYFVIGLNSLTILAAHS